MGKTEELYNTFKFVHDSIRNMYFKGEAHKGKMLYNLDNGIKQSTLRDTEQEFLESVDKFFRALNQYHNAKKAKDHDIQLPLSP